MVIVVSHIMLQKFRTKKGTLLLEEGKFVSHALLRFTLGVLTYLDIWYFFLIFPGGINPHIFGIEGELIETTFLYFTK